MQHIKVRAHQLISFFSHPTVENLLGRDGAFSVLCVQLRELTHENHQGALRFLVCREVHDKWMEIVDHLREKHGFRVNPEDPTDISAIPAEENAS